MPELDDFNSRERDILRLIGREKRTAPQAAEELNLSVRTVHNYTYELAQKLPGDTKPRYRLMLFVDDLDEEDRRRI